ncbi:MAG: adenylosuccinate synthetase [Bacilli bacterium]|nr:adenylosuccinate synthetase [Bacilli bacterium]
MSVTIIYGGQFGSEGKGKVAHYFAVKEHAKYCVRVGGPNSGHTVYRGNEKLIFRILPTGVIEKDIIAVLPAGAYIDLGILRQEMKVSGIGQGRLLIDENAVIITEAMRKAENESNLRDRIGSTTSGTGEAVIHRILRKDEGMLAKNCPELKPYIRDTKTVMRNACDNGEKIVVEGTQGYGLSLLHAKDYPYVTSRDTSAAAILAETGLSPFDVENIVMVIRAFPIRVSGKSGPLPEEIDWQTVQKESGRSDDLTEYTSCTNRIRRVARFDSDVVNRSIRANRPNIVVLNHFDYFADYENTAVAEKRLKYISSQINVPLTYIGTSPKDLIEFESFIGGK